MINTKLMEMFLEKAVGKLSGEWIVIGGTVLPLMGIDHRVTVDIDIINLSFESSNNDSLKLMNIAQELKLPIESINQAGAYYLSKIENVNEHLVILRQSKKCKIYRPDAYLFIRLKIERFSETDLSDCLTFIKKNEEEYLLHKKEIIRLIQTKIKTARIEVQKRLALLLKCVI
jgi:hypothetical protein